VIPYCLISSKGSNLSAAPILVLLFLCLASSGCREAAKLTQQQMEGKHLYQVRCAHCHGENDLALKKIPPDLHGLFKNATLPSGAPANDQEVRRVVLAGKGMMPAFTGRFDEAQMSALLAYLHTGLR
jgi:mono/diheme cytochrome c family protein